MVTTQLIPDEKNQPLVEASEQISNIIESFIELGILVHDNQGTSQSNKALTTKLQSLITQLSKLNDIPNLNQKLIPLDVMSYIEDGRNPDIYTREFIEVNAKSNARIKGKMKGFEKLRDVLGDKLVNEYPKLEVGVEDIKKRTESNGLE
ncbi:NUT2 [Candida pseudojiufengensis]|uniref:NUT2 n=1 Tax=Candida pseudojiufengensis TaxID=497109 RepID=UPI002225B063|nr:NUT2 [Candida pseudojiufengensis]KAI5963706.1 NUT2 [Candida pseudojiufengensis]